MSSRTVNPMPDVIWIALITFGGGLIGSFFTRYLDRKKARHEINKTIAETSNIDADTANVLVEAAKKAVESLVPNLAKRIQDLEREAEVQKQEADAQKRLNRRYANRIIYLMRGIEQLVEQITGLGPTPDWTPDEWDLDKET